MHCFFQRPPSLEYKSDKTVFGTYYDTLTLVKDPVRENASLSKAPLTSLNGVTLRFIIPVFTHAQPLFLTAVAVNRLTAICFPLKHAVIWSARTVAAVVVTLAMMAMLLGAGTSVVSIVRQIAACWTATAKEREDLSCGAWWVFYEVCILLRNS